MFAVVRLEKQRVFCTATQSFLFDRTDIFAEVMEKALSMAQRGELGKLPEPSLYKLEHVGRAHADIESGMTTGKLVLDVR